MAEENYRLLRSYITLPEAELDFIKLKDEELSVYLRDSNMANLMPHYSLAVGGVKIYIKESEYEKGLEVISYEINKEREVNEVYAEEQLEPELICPKCGSSNYYPERSWIVSLMFTFVFSVPFSIPKNIYRCSNCKHRWKVNNE